MAVFEIAQGSGRGYTITLYMEAETDPALNISLQLVEINRIAGNNNFDVPAGHLQNEWQVTVFDRGNNLFDTLSYYDKRFIVEIVEGGNLRLRGHAQLSSYNFYFTRPADNITLLCDDGLISLQRQSTVSALKCRTLKQIGAIFQELGTGVFPAAAVKIKMGLSYNGASGQGGAVSMQHRISVESLVRDMDQPNDYELLKRLCEDFELCIFQEDGDFYVLDSYSRSQDIQSLYNVDVGMESVDFSTEMTSEQMRAEPYSFSPKPFDLIETTNEVLSANEEILNPGFESWVGDDQFDPDQYPTHWCYDDVSRFERIALNIVRALGEGRIIYQYLLTGSSRFTQVDLNFDMRVTWNVNTLQSGTAEIKMARLRILTATGFKGYNESTEEFEAGNDGYLTVQRDYPKDFAATGFVQVPETVIIVEESIVLLELYYLPNDLARVVVSENQITYSHAELSLSSPAESMEFSASTGQYQPELTRNSYISDVRASYMLGDIEYYDDAAAEWKAAGDDWGSGHFRIYEMTSRRISIWGHKLRIFELPTFNGEYFHLYDEIKLHYMGEVINCIPIRIKSSVRQISQNIIRLIECEAQTATEDIRLSPDREVI